MVVKYLCDETWGYIDNIREAAVREFNGASLLSQYELEVARRERIVDTENSESFMNGEPLEEDIAKSNKLFIMVSEEIKDMVEEINAHMVNMVLINENVTEHMPLYAVLLYLENDNEYDAIVYITNQRCYLMNDTGKTIDRLV